MRDIGPKLPEHHEYWSTVMTKSEHCTIESLGEGVFMKWALGPMGKLGIKIHEHPEGSNTRALLRPGIEVY